MKIEMGLGVSTRREYQSWNEAVKIARTAGLDFDERDIASISAEYRDENNQYPRFIDPTHKEKFDYSIIIRITTIFKHKPEYIELMVMMYLNRYYAQLTASTRRGYVAKHVRNNNTVLLLEDPSDPGSHLERECLLLPKVKKDTIVMTWYREVMPLSKYRLMVKIPSVRDGILLEGCNAHLHNPAK